MRVKQRGGISVGDSSVGGTEQVNSPTPMSARTRHAHTQRTRGPGRTARAGAQHPLGAPPRLHLSPVSSTELCSVVHGLELFCNFMCRRGTRKMSVFLSSTSIQHNFFKLMDTFLTCILGNKNHCA